MLYFSQKVFNFSLLLSPVLYCIAQNNIAQDENFKKYDQEKL